MNQPRRSSTNGIVRINRPSARKTLKSNIIPTQQARQGCARQRRKTSHLDGNNLLSFCGLAKSSGIESMLAKKNKGGP
jgi:tetraacyldisaccharide-1-P 4'-kinase